MDDDALVANALSISGSAYCPYSGYAVGACLQTADGAVYSACNVENASYGLSICAERSAAVMAVAHGSRVFAKIAIAAKGAMPYPCGACLQVLREFGPDDMPIILTNGKRVERTTLCTLLPARFTLDDPE